MIRLNLTVFLLTFISIVGIHSNSSGQVADTAKYCKSYALNPDNELISEFTLGSIVYRNGNSVFDKYDSGSKKCYGYQNFTDQTLFVYPNQQLEGSITVGSCNLKRERVAAVFIDWNGDFDFDDVDEKVFATPLLCPGKPGLTCTATFTVTVPDYIPQGKVGVIRVMGRYTDGILDTSDYDPCGLYTFGETQDYSLIYTADDLGVPNLFNYSKYTTFDFDYDGDLDLVLGDGTTTITLENILESGELSFIYSDKQLPVFPDFLINYNQDSLIDFISDTLVYINLGDSYQKFPTALPGKVQNLIDYDNDGDQDFIIDDKLYRNEFTSFSYQFEITHGKVFDFDNDGDQDLMNANTIYRNVDGSLDANVKLYDNEYSEFISNEIPLLIGDLDQDGYYNIIQVIDRGNENGWAGYIINTNLSQETFTETEIYADLRAWSFSLISIADMDGDGLEDIIISYIDDYFVGDLQNTLDTLFIPLTDPLIIDLDNNGVLDVVDRNLVYLREAANNQRPVPPSNTNVNIIDNDVSFTWDPGSDVETNNASLYYNVSLKRGNEYVVHPFSSANGKRIQNDLGNAQLARKFIIKDLPTGNYEFAVQSIDHTSRSSAFSEIVKFNIDSDSKDEMVLLNIDQHSTHFNKKDSTFVVVFKRDSSLYAQFLYGNSFQAFNSPFKLSNSITNTIGDKFHLAYDEDRSNYLASWVEHERVSLVKFDKKGITIPQVNLEARPMDSLDLYGSFGDGGHYLNGNLIYFYYEAKDNNFRIRILQIKESENDFNLISSDTLITTMKVSDVDRDRWIPEIDEINGSFEFNQNSQKYVLALNLNWTLLANREYYGGYSDNLVRVSSNIIVFGINEIPISSSPWSEVLLFNNKIESQLSYDPIIDQYLFTYNKRIFRDKDGGVYLFNNEIHGFAFTLNDSATGYDSLTNEIRISKSILTNAKFEGGHSVSTTWIETRNEFLSIWNYNEQIKSIRHDPLNDFRTVENEEFFLVEEKGLFPQAIQNTYTNEYLLSYYLKNTVDPSYKDVYTLFLKSVSLKKDPIPILDSMDIFKENIGDSLAVYKAYSGDTVNLYGNHFSKTSFLNEVRFGDIKAEVIEKFNDSLSIRVIVPPGLNRDAVPISLTFDKQTGTSSPKFLFEALTKPFVDSLSMYEGEAGDTVLIYGDKFASNFEEMIVKFGNSEVTGNDAISINENLNVISVKVPEGTSRGAKSVSVTIQGQKVSDTTALFRTIIAPKISEVKPLSGQSCDQITIKGTDFSEDASKLVVKFGEIMARPQDIQFNSSTQLLVKVPFGVKDSVDITVTTDDRTARYFDIFYGRIGSEITDYKLSDEYVTLNSDFSSIPVSVNVLNSCSVKDVKLWMKGQTQNDGAWIASTIDLEGNKGERYLERIDLADDQGVSYYFQTTDSSGYKDSTEIFHMYNQSVAQIIGSLGQAGETVDIQGINLSTKFSELDIRFDTIKVQEDEIITMSDSLLRIKVPIGLPRGNVSMSMKMRGDDMEINHDYKVIIYPKINSISDFSGSRCTENIVIKGTNFSNVRDEVRVFFGEILLPPEDINYVSQDSISVRVPKGLKDNSVFISVEIDGKKYQYSDKMFKGYLGYEIVASGYENIAGENTLGIIDIKNQYSAITVWVELRETDLCTTDPVRFYWRKIRSSDNGWNVEGELMDVYSSDKGFKKALESSKYFTDEMGIEYFYSITDADGNVTYSDTLSILKKYVDPVAERRLSEHINFGTETSDYNIFSLPYEFEDPDVSRVLKSIGPSPGGYNKTIWRMFHYNNETNKQEEYGDDASFNTIEPGKGYWLLANVEGDSIEIEGGKVVDITDGPFTITLQSGWNQIGNPYNFNVSWQDVLQASGLISEVGPYNSFIGTGFEESSKMEPYKGGFVKNTTASPIELIIPFRTSSSGGRKAKANENGWHITLRLKTLKYTSSTGGFGMRDGAQIGADSFDKYNVPRFMNYVEVVHGEDVSDLSMDIVPPIMNYNWTFRVESNMIDKKVEMKWDINSVRGIEGELYLLELLSGRYVNMKQKNKLEFTNRKDQKFQVIYGDENYVKEQIYSQSDILVVYPNPFTDNVKIPYVVKKSNSTIFVSVYNIQGKLIRSIEEKSIDTGYFEMEWDGLYATGKSTPPGVYFIKMSGNGLEKICKVIRSN